MKKPDPTSAQQARRRFLKQAPFLAGVPAVITHGKAPSASYEAGRRAAAAEAAAEKIRAVVPRPRLPGRPDLIAMYDKCWEIGLQKTQLGTPANGFVHWYVDAAFDHRIFQWDTSFSLAWAKYAQGALPSVESHDNFYRKQHADGAISGVIRKGDGTDDQPKDSPWFTRNNLFSWIEYEYYRTTGDASRLARVIPILKRYAAWVRTHRRHPNGHYFWSGWSSGMDNSPRSRADQFYPPYSWIDYDANEALAAYYLAEMADVIGDEATAAEMRAIHAELKTLVNRDMWSSADGFYWDLDRDGSMLKVKTIASFWPLWARLTEEEQVEGLVRHLNDEASFNRPHRVPTLAADQETYCPQGCYWRGSVWAPTNHMVVKGLTAQGRRALAREIAVNHLENMVRVFEETGTVWENYAPEAAAPGDPAKGDFVGWSAVGPVAQLIETYIGLQLDVPENTIHWNLLTTEEVGLSNLKFGDVTIDIVAEARRSLEDPVELQIRTPKPFTIRLHDGQQETVLEVPAGEHELVALATGKLPGG